MGQFYNHQKIGTCEDMYYLRLDTALELAKQGAKDDDGVTFEEYTTDNITRFRFPWPAEDPDSSDILSIPNLQYDRSYTFPAGSISMGHCDICIAHHPDNTDNINIFLPCLYDPKFKALGLKTSQIGEPKISVCMEGVRNGKRTTIFKCARCGQMFTLTEEETKILKAEATAYAEQYRAAEERGENPIYSDTMAIIARIR